MFAHLLLSFSVHGDHIGISCSPSARGYHSGSGCFPSARECHTSAGCSPSVCRHLARSCCLLSERWILHAELGIWPEQTGSILLHLSPGARFAILAAFWLPGSSWLVLTRSVGRLHISHVSYVPFLDAAASWPTASIQVFCGSALELYSQIVMLKKLINSLFQAFPASNVVKMDTKIRIVCYHSTSVEK